MGWGVGWGRGPPSDGLSRLHVVPSPPVFGKILFSKPGSIPSPLLASVPPVSRWPLLSFLSLPFSPVLLSPPHGGLLQRVPCVNSIYLEHPSSQTGVNMAPLAPFPPRSPAAFAKPRERSVGHRTPAGQRPGSGRAPETLALDRKPRRRGSVDSRITPRAVTRNKSGAAVATQKSRIPSCYSAGIHGNCSGQPADFKAGGSLFPRDQGRGANSLSPWKRGS